MSKLNVIDWIALILVIVGAVNWGLVGLLNLDLVAKLFGTSALATIVYVLVGLAGIYLIYLAMSLGKKGGMSSGM